MRSLVFVLLSAACATRTGYVPGGDGLPDAARAAYRKAVEKEWTGDAEGALAIFDELCAAHPLRLGIHLHRLRLTRDTKGAAEAAKLYEPAPPGVDAERAAALASLARLPEDDVSGRMAVLEAATAREPFEPFWRLAVAHTKVTAQRIVAERSQLERDLGKVQAAAESLVESDRLLEEARQEAETALGHDNGLKEAHVLLGFIATRRADRFGNDLEQRDTWRNLAEFHYAAAIELDPECLTARLNRAENFLYFDKYREAARELEVAVRLAPNVALAWNNLGLTYYSIGRLSAAVDAYREALALEPDNARIRAALADGLRRQGKVDEALAELERARAAAGDDRELQAEIAFKLAAIHEHEDRYQEAVAEYQRHIDLEGRDSAKAKSRIRYIYAHAFED